MSQRDAERSVESQKPSGAAPASSLLIAAALAGLAGIAAVAACSEDKAGSDSHLHPNPAPGVCADAGTVPTDPATGDGGGVDAGFNNVVRPKDAGELTPAEFQALCDEKGGYVYVNAYCGGSAMCKGLSYHGGVLTEHSCKAINVCGGVGCVYLPPDKGLTGKELYESGPCGNCHGDWSDSDSPNFNSYTVVHGDDLTGEQALARFENSTDKRLVSITVWGTTGFHGDTPYYNMPTYYPTYSLAEIKRVIEHIKTLPKKTDRYDIWGAPPRPDAGPDGGPPH